MEPAPSNQVPSHGSLSRGPHSSPHSPVWVSPWEGEAKVCISSWDWEVVAASPSTLTTSSNRARGLRSLLSSSPSFLGLTVLLGGGSVLLWPSYCLGCL